MDLLKSIEAELVRWEEQKQHATALYNEAVYGLQTLYLLTERMKQEAEYEQNSKHHGLEEAEATRD